MDNNALEILKQRIVSMSDEDLLKMVKIDFAEYQEEAINLAKKELEDRNIQETSKEKIEELVGISKQEEKTKISEKWLDIYVYFGIPLTLLRDLIFIVRTPIHNAPYIIFDIVLICLFFGLHKRRLWGWKLNWIVLVILTFLRPLGLDRSGRDYILYLIFFSLLWLLPNYIYFKKRRHLFNPKLKMLDNDKNHFN